MRFSRSRISGRGLGVREEGIREIDLAEVVQGRGVVYFRLESDRFEQLGRLMGASLIVDLVTLSADLQGGSMRAMLMIDEFASVAAEQIGRLFATARGAGLSALLISQGLADVKAAEANGAAPTLVAQVVQNVSYVLAHRQTDPDAREFLSRIAGTYETWALAEQVEGEVLRRRTGDGSRFPTHEFNVHPNEFKSLGQGSAVVIEAGSNGGSSGFASGLLRRLEHEREQGCASRGGAPRRASRRHRPAGGGDARGSSSRGGRRLASRGRPDCRIHRLAAEPGVCAGISSADPVHHDGSALIARRSELDRWLQNGGGVRP